MPRVAIIGLDSLAPALVFDALAAELPHLTGLARAGVAGAMLSTLPPITVPAWACMFTGRDPGELGLYGFHDRADRSYDRRRLASSLSFSAPPLWQLASRAGLRVRLLGVPQTYPPKPVRGACVAGPPIPDTAECITYPAELEAELRAQFGPWRDDLPDFRDRPRAQLYADLVALATQHFAVARDWARRDDWDLLVFVTLTPDRLQHAFWSEPPAGELVDFYRYLDAEVGELCAALRPDDVVLVVSDHGAQTNRGGFALNDYLRQRGDLVLKNEPTRLTALRPELVDWPRTRAWADGGYVGRIYLNQRGREPAGLLADDEVETFLTALGADLAGLHGPSGRPWRNQILRPSLIFAAQHGVPPDLFLLLDDLAVRPLGTVGHATLFPRDNDRGPDAANHAAHGVFILRDAAGARPPPDALTLYDVTPTVLAALGLAPPPGLRGRSLWRSNPPTG